jgi:hypothetical protein
MLPSLPRPILPDTWAAKTRCPVCGACALRVQHIPEDVDVMACRVCQSAFEVEENGEYLRFTRLAAPLAEILANRWVTMAEVKEAISSAHRNMEDGAQVMPATGDSFSQPADLQPPEKTLSGEEVLARAKALYGLGNSPEQVASTLAQNLLITPDQIQAARSALAAQNEQKGRRQNLFFYISGAAAIALIIMCLVAGILSPFFNYPSTSGKMIPVVPTDIIRAVTPEVIQEPLTGAVVAVCPTTRTDAARLFGGEARDWTKKSDGWRYLTTPQATVHLPKGMSALLLLDVNLKTANLVGPATINNVFAMTIYCR